VTGSRVIVTGVGGPAGRAVASGLVERGFDVLGVDMAAIAIPGITSARVPAAGEPGFVGEIGELARRHGVAAIVPTVSEELTVLAAARQVLVARGVEVILTSRSSIGIAADKWRTARHLAAAGVGVPRSMLGGEGRPHRDPAEVLGLPFLSKPRVGRGGRGVAVHRRSEGAPAIDLDATTILQEFVPGIEYSVNLFLGDRWSEDLAVVLEKTALRGGAVGNATAVARSSETDVAELACHAARALGLSGPLDVDVRRRADGTPLVLEANARFGANIGQAPEVLDALVHRKLEPAVMDMAMAA
jgi:carbamoylphosphate synthase large subunit